MITKDEIINSILEYYEFHKRESDYWGKILGILRLPVALPAKKQTLPPPTGLKVSEPKPKKIDEKTESRLCKDPRCKKKFKPVRKDQVYCSKECSGKGSVYLNYINKKQAKETGNGKEVKEEKVDPVLKKDDLLIEKHHPSKKGIHLHAESFYNGLTTMP